MANPFLRVLGMRNGGKEFHVVRNNAAQADTAEEWVSGTFS